MTENRSWVTGSISYNVRKKVEIHWNRKYKLYVLLLTTTPWELWTYKTNERWKHMRKQEGLFPATLSTLCSFKALFSFYLVFTVCN